MNLQNDLDIITNDAQIDETTYNIFDITAKTVSRSELCQMFL